MRQDSAPPPSTVSQGVSLYLGGWYSSPRNHATSYPSYISSVSSNPEHQTVRPNTAALPITPMQPPPKCSPWLRPFSLTTVPETQEALRKDHYTCPSRRCTASLVSEPPATAQLHDHFQARCSRRSLWSISLHIASTMYRFFPFSFLSLALALTVVSRMTFYQSNGTLAFSTFW